MKTFDALKELSKEERPVIGKYANQVKQALESAYEDISNRLRQSDLATTLQAEGLDVTLPGRPAPRGRLHPTTLTLREIYRAFAEMGFQVYRSREVETDEYNFELLNMPAHHPARDMWDTFHTTTPGVLLRTHTSPGQIHVMRQYCPEPIRVILPGMCYRYEQVSARKETQFNQVEGLAVGQDITMGDLKGTLTDFARRMFGQEVRTRFRASHFPFTEPSAEMDVECFICGGNRLRCLCRQRLAGDPGLRHGASRCAAQRRLRSPQIYRLCLRPGSRAHHHAAPPHPGHPLFLDE